MDSYELNKIAGAFLFALLTALALITYIPAIPMGLLWLGLCTNQRSQEASS